MRVSQLALHTSKVVLCARLQAVALHFNRKIFHHLPQPNLALARLQSLAITLIRFQLCIASLAAPTHAKEEECSSYDTGLCYSNPLGTCSYAKKGDVLCTSNPKALCQQIMPSSSTVSTHQPCVQHGLLVHLCRHGALLCFSLHQKEESSTTIRNHATTAAAPRHPFIYAAGKYTQVYAKVI